MKDHIYSQLDERFFVLDYSASHRQLLLRSKRHKSRAYNIDVIFKGVDNLFMPTQFDGIQISILEDGDMNQILINQYFFKSDKNYIIFKMTDSKDNVWYLNAMCFGVYHSDLDILETSIGRYDMEDRGERVLWFS